MPNQMITPAQRHRDLLFRADRLRQRGEMAAADELRNRVIIDLVPVAYRIAGRHGRTLRAGGMSVVLDDLRSIASLALVEAVDAWDADRNVPVEAWATMQITWTLLRHGKEAIVCMDEFPLELDSGGDDHLTNEPIRDPREQLDAALDVHALAGMLEPAQRELLNAAVKDEMGYAQADPSVRDRKRKALRKLQRRANPGPTLFTPDA